MRYQLQDADTEQVYGEFPSRQAAEGEMFHMERSMRIHGTWVELVIVAVKAC